MKELVFYAFSLLVVVLVAVPLLSLLVAGPVMLLVNYVFTPAAIQSVFGSQHLDFGHAFALTLLCGILFKSSGSSGSSKP